MRTGTYIVYNKETNEIVRRFDWYGHAIEDFIKQSNDDNITWLNRTHPKNATLLPKLWEA